MKGITDTGRNIKVKMDISSETMQAIRKENYIFKLLKGKKKKNPVNPIFYTGMKKQYYKDEGEK